MSTKIESIFCIITHWLTSIGVLILATVAIIDDNKMGKLEAEIITLTKD